MPIDIGWTGIISGTDNGDAVETKLTNTFQEIEDTLNALFNLAEHGILLATSSSSNQLPTGLGAANSIQVEFGAAQSTTEVSVDVNGNVTFHEAGTYSIRFAAHFGRTGGTGTSLLAFRALLNDVQYGDPQMSKLDNADMLLAWADIYTIQANVNDVMKGELMRVLGSNDSGGLYATDTTEWGTAKSASIQIHKVG